MSRRTSHRNKIKTPNIEKTKKDTPSSTLKKYWQLIWNIFGPISFLYSIYIYISPDVSIKTGANIDINQQFQTQFIVSNNGNLTINNVKFSCALIGNSAYVSSLKIEKRKTLADVKSLSAKETVSRGCFAESLVGDGPWLKVTINYHWFFSFFSATDVAYFSVRTGASGSFLVPEARPIPEPPTLISI